MIYYKATHYFPHERFFLFTARGGSVYTFPAAKTSSSNLQLCYSEI